MTPQPFHSFAPTLFFLWRFLFACFSYVSLHLSPILTSNRPPVCVFIRPPPPIHLDRVEECEEDSIEEEKEEEEEETPVTESDSDEQEGANETTSRYFRT